MANTKPLTRLYVILARNANVGVIFRRGPSKQVCLIKWDMINDTFEDGQWFKGRIYEHRGDLSPDGKRLIYFASKQKLPDYPTWTAISRIPYLTALLWWKEIGTYGGGGRGSNDPWYLIEYNLCETKSENNLSLGVLDWADWDKNGDLLYAKDGKLFRLKPDPKSEFQYDPDNAIELRDFSHMTFEEKEAPAWALKWK